MLLGVVRKYYTDLHHNRFFCFFKKCFRYKRKALASNAEKSHILPADRELPSYPASSVGTMIERPIQNCQNLYTHSQDCLQYYCKYSPLDIPLY